MILGSQDVLLPQPRRSIAAPVASRAALSGPPELWGGLECSVVRLAEHWRDQVCATGHQTRGNATSDRFLDHRNSLYPARLRGDRFHAGAEA